MHRRIVLASNNAGKIREWQALLADLNCTVIPQGALHIGETEETAESFVENALFKARNAARASGLPALADDSGLVVDVLGGAPGVHSARYAGAAAGDAANVAKLLRELAGVPPANRTARFYCATVFLLHPADPCPAVGCGVWEGSIAMAPRGERGFGYDPVFLLPGAGRTAAELAAEEKNRLSHRAQAAVALLGALRRKLLPERGSPC